MKATRADIQRLPGEAAISVRLKGYKEAAAWITGRVVSVLGPSKVVTESNRLYELGEVFNRQEMEHNGFSAGTTQHFERGFPSNWREVLGAPGCWSEPAETNTAQVLCLQSYGLSMDAAGVRTLC